MAVSENTGGAQTCTLDTEHTLATITSAGTYQLVLEFNNAVDGDVFVIRIKTKVRSASTERVLFERVIAHAQAEANWCSPPLGSPFSIKFTIEQTDGTGRSVGWSVYSY